MANNGNTENKLKHEDSLKLTWEELKLRIDAYQKYLNTALQVTAFYYAITGAVLGFYLNRPDGRAVYFLLLPIFMGAVLGGIFLYAARLQKKASYKIKGIIKNINKELYTGIIIKKFDDVDLLRLMLLIFGYIFFIVSISLTLMPLMRKFIEVFAFPHWAAFGVLAIISLFVGRYAGRIVNLIYKGAMLPDIRKSVIHPNKSKEKQV